MSMSDVKAEILTAMQAGSETTSLNVALAVFHIARNPDVKHRLQNELDHAEQTGKIPPRTAMISYDQALELPFLTACIRESLRYTPSVAQIPRKAPPDTGLNLHGRHIPPGTSVSTSAWIVGRDTNLYGEDSNTFRPARWLEASEDKLRKMDKFDFVFGYGARRCLGRHVASIQLWKSIAEVFRRFDVELADCQTIHGNGVPCDWGAAFHIRD
ncbi:Cytochrome P450 monooxygenase ustC [Lasiodiplodia theobromae]|uniref:Cytochrome P450 monooxygenase ustC n=1 Tax=Lasiodiplodia theobromae TaxID=45133 RepID=A0A5N5D0T6_9PEZI|nr:Cytochrome P450 monooxygenase ustC [Lasiodiplodia theobromae]